MKWLLGLFLLFCFACSSLSPVLSPDVSPTPEKPCPNANELGPILQNSLDLGNELKSLKQLFLLLKSSSGNLGPLMQVFEEKLTVLETELKAAHELSSGQLKEINQLRKGFDDYRAAVARDKIVIGVASGLGGLILGLVFGLLL